MKLRTELERTRLQRPIDCGQPLFLVGSCFTTHIGQWLTDCWLPVCCNPWGTLFNPASIAMSLQRANTDTDYTPTLQQAPDGTYCSFDHHGLFNSKDADRTRANILRAEAEAKEKFRSAEHVLVTFGTAWVFEREGMVVANCHKRPAREFVRRRLKADEIVQMWKPILESGDRHFIFTVSPIRHLADGLHDNQLSKATLLLAIDRLQSLYPGRVEYLPVYELLMDDLRDYRFYDEDLVHPAPIAQEAVRELFLDTVATPHLQQYIQRAEPLVKALRHIPSDPNSAEYKEFLSLTRSKVDALKCEYGI